MSNLKCTTKSKSWKVYITMSLTNVTYIKSCILENGAGTSLIRLRNMDSSHRKDIKRLKQQQLRHTTITLSHIVGSVRWTNQVGKDVAEFDFLVKENVAASYFW